MIHNQAAQAAKTLQKILLAGRLAELRRSLCDPVVNDFVFSLAL
jgi:hypothetical protein